ncbi:thiolase family protein [Dichotomicrobium thermohalophilum]|uniref:Acetyl-CoA C-acetyltransferase n=1 Tax=Dichotomicrobium thermohalophilum TaxID=933063 RepID=A0A397Q423_9HYPH|nr:thiolase family protein [Dichotomicrobium thermohalophilum]RIA55882.1 acetyl-CoA C-acetyltransferase [Dichotomicrobium thermohalophilum]
MNQPIIIAARRTAIGNVGGMHRARPIETLGATAVMAALADSGLGAADIGEVIMGNAAGGGGNPARLIALSAGLPDTVPAITVDRQCASGLDAITAGARLIQTGAVEAVIAGGAESPSTAPWRVEKPASLYRGLPRFFGEAQFAPGAAGDRNMIEAAERVALERGISREMQDAYALASHERAAAAAAAGLFDAEIVAADGGAERDEGPKPGLKPETLARAVPLLPDGTVTAGNSCPVSDGAAAVVMVSHRLHARLGHPPGLAFVDSAAGGVDPQRLGLGAIPAVERLRDGLGERWNDLGAIEFNEAFASQVLATTAALDLPVDVTNPHGGAIALGHPYGASGAVLVVRLFTRMAREGVGGLGLAMVAAAGGLGVATAFATVCLPQKK